jgi:hypothetical protein
MPKKAFYFRIFYRLRTFGQSRACFGHVLNMSQGLAIGKLNSKSEVKCSKLRKHHSFATFLRFEVWILDFFRIPGQTVIGRVRSTIPLEIA